MLTDANEIYDQVFLNALVNRRNTREEHKHKTRSKSSGDIWLLDVIVLDNNAWFKNIVGQPALLGDY